MKSLNYKKLVIIILNDDYKSTDYK